MKEHTIPCDKCNNYRPSTSGEDVYMLRTCVGRNFGTSNRSLIIKDVMNGLDKKCPSFERL